MSQENYLIGIDLGTTNCTLAYCSINKNSPIRQFAIPQISLPNTQSESFSLPSALYFPLAEEQEKQVAGISWDPKRNFCIGSFALKRGAEIPDRLVTSAKSWLCHSGINRRESVLPINAEEGLAKISPLDACAEILRHLREAWDNKIEARFIDQKVFITVPASFDPSARQLVQEAALKAGYPEVVLLEEPQAAFYAWLDTHQDSWRQILKVHDRILVIDIGGGTTDFSLIGVKDENGNLALNRQAVGAHLLLGGDNIDLSLAHLAKNKLENEGHYIDDWQFLSLIQNCRHAKEILLGETPPESVDLTIMGRGSRLIGGSLKTQISLKEALKLVIDGFAPIVSPSERSQIERKSGLKQSGLPYTEDARFSCQLAKFLSMTGEDNSASMENFVMPTAILFNGGTTKANALRERLINQLNLWAEELGKPKIVVLPEADYDFAVSRGAVNYAKARYGQTIRIRSGTSRSYFIGVEDAMPAVPGLQPSLKAICVAPFGMEEGMDYQLENQEFALVLGEQATFRFFSHATPKLSDGTEPAIGASIRKWKQELTELHPIETILDKSIDDGKTVQVKIRSRVTELGVLEVWCVSQDDRKWKLEFDIRKDESLMPVK